MVVVDAAAAPGAAAAVAMAAGTDDGSDPRCPRWRLDDAATDDVGGVEVACVEEKTLEN